jgi:tetratricopeptide (TPR) repeat protein
MGRINALPLICLLAVVAICTPALSDTLDRIEDPVLRNYAMQEVIRGAPALEVPARVLYREALELCEKGNWRQARERLILSSSLADDYPDPLFTLARIELLNAQPDFLFYLFEGITRLAKSFYHQSLIAANAAILFVTGMLGTLLVVLVILAIKHWSLIDHWLRERYAQRLPAAPAGWISVIAVAALLVMRLGIALYITILIVIVWSCIGRREKAAVLCMTAIIAASSFFARYADTFIPAIDPGSITHRLSLINEQGTDDLLLGEIAGIDDPEYRAEKEFALGTLLYRKRDYSGAKHYLLSSVSERRDFAPAYLALGNVYFMEEEYDKALAGYQNVVAIDSTNALAYYNIGQTYIKKMLFSKSSAALDRANKYGINQHQEANLSSRIMNVAVYESAFDNEALWSLAFREGQSHARIYLSDVLRPYLLFPFERLWILLVIGVACAIVIGAKSPRSWNVFRCDNCQSATCDMCADTETGLRLCSKCSNVISGLSSVKVMEALLRHRRQTVWARMNRRTFAWKNMFWPGASFVYRGQLFTGFVYILIGVWALMVLVWRGFYFEDFRAITISVSMWKVIPPLVVLSLGYILSLRARSQQEQRNYRILPPEMWTQVKERDTVKKEPVMRQPPEPDECPPSENPAQPMGSFIDL